MLQIDTGESAVSNWETVYYPNPVPLSSRTLLSMALLFDRVHFPGITLFSPVRLDAASKRKVLQTWLAGSPGQLMKNMQNLGAWAIEQEALDFVHLPDLDPKHTAYTAQLLQTQALKLLDDTYGAGLAQRAIGFEAAEGFAVPAADVYGSALVWPFYQARALQYSYDRQLPLMSDDPLSIPPLPSHPQPQPDVKGLAQQLAFEAINLVLPPFASVEPSAVADFRGHVQPIAVAFRAEMVKMSAELGAAIAAGANNGELKKACEYLARTRVAPALKELSRQLKEPIRPWSDWILNITEAALTAYSSLYAPSLAISWAILSGTKIASDYARLYTDRQGKKKSGLSYLLKIEQFKAGSGSNVSDWDKRDWRCSGNVKIPDPGQPLTLENQVLMASIPPEKRMTIRNVYQTRTESVVIVLGG